MNALLAQSAFTRLLQARRILITTDVRIDGDTVGSSLGLFHVLRSLGKDVLVYAPVPIPSAYGFLPGADLITEDASVLMDPTIDIMVSCDCGDGAHVVDIQSKIPSHPFLISFDHHDSNTLYGDCNLVLVEASSTAEVVWRFLKTVKQGIPREAATAILTGVCTDTDIFKNLATNATAFDAASDLMLAGARVKDVERHLFSNKPISALRLWGRVLERLRRHRIHDVVTTYILQSDFTELGCQEEDLEGLVNVLMSLLQDVDTVMVFRETKNGGVKGSLRTISGNVARFGEWFPNGGGHVKAAGLWVPRTRLRPCQGGVEVVGT